MTCAPYDTATMSLFGLGQQKPHHYREMLKVAWENRDQLPFAWRILSAAASATAARWAPPACRDWTLPGTHLCMVRLELLRLNTAPALDPRSLAIVAPLRRPHVTRAARARPAAGADAAARRRARLSRRHWDEALDRIAREARATSIRSASRST